MSDRTYIAIDLKSFYASVECVDRGLDPLTTNLVVADRSRTEKTICLAVSPSLKAYGIGGRARLFEVVQRVRAVNYERRREAGWHFTGKSVNDTELKAHPDWELDYIAAPPRMAHYIEVSTKVYQTYLKYIAPEDIHVYSIDEVFMDVTSYLRLYKTTAHELAMRMIRDVLATTGITATAGIGSNMYLAKVAMDIVAKHVAADKDGVRIAELDELSYRQKLWNHRQLTAFWRVGRGIAERLAQYGITTMGQIARKSLHNEEFFYQLFGVNAELLIDHAWGWEPCTIDYVKAYKPEFNSFSSGQVLQELYSNGKARVVAHLDFNGQCLSHEDFVSLMQLAQEQAVVGLVSQGLMDSGIKLEREDALNLFAVQQSIRRQNAMMDKAVVELCQRMADNGIRIFVFKGLTVGALYPDHSLRQSGDIDFYCYHEDWDKAVSYFRDEVGLKLNDLSARKDVSFHWNGVVYEMHNRITMFCYPGHERYWTRTVMPEILEHPYTVKVNDYDVPTLAPTYNALFIFIHIFQHLIADGIALRQFCDWARVLSQQVKNEELIADNYSIDVLERHLKGLGLLKAYTGLGALLTEYLGLPEEQFPFKIREKDRERLPALWQNMQERGNFGHNVKYKNKNMMAHGIEHLWRMTKQAREFYHYAPAEAWWHIPSMVPWWVIKIRRIVGRWLAVSG